MSKSESKKSKKSKEPKESKGPKSTKESKKSNNNGKSTNGSKTVSKKESKKKGSKKEAPKKESKKGAKKEAPKKEAPKKESKKGDKKKVPKKGSEKTSAKQKMPSGLSNKELIAKLAEKTEMDKKEVKKVIESLGSLMEEELSGDPPKVFNMYGYMKVVKTSRPASPARTMRKPGSTTGEMIKVAAKPASTRIRVRPLKKVKDIN